MQSKIPSKKAIIITWVVLLVHSTFYFTRNAEESFFQLNYDWDNVRILGNLRNVIIDSISHDYLVLENSCLESNGLLNSNNTFIIGESNSFFRASNVKCEKGRIVFSGIKWINNIPKYKMKNTDFKIADLPLIQSGKIKVITIGDSQIIWRKGREFRKNLSKNENLIFIGNEKDIYGYGHEAVWNGKCADFINILKNIESADFYILFFGAHDKNTNYNELEECIHTTFEILLRRSSGNAKILAVTLPPSTNTIFNNYNQNFNHILLKEAKENKRIKVINIYEVLQNEKNYLYDDNVHLNEKGYHFLNKLLIDELR
jgi:lysophospholipase L1-like esterase